MTQEKNDEKEKARKAGGTRLDANSHAIIYGGASLSQLAEIFESDKRTIKRKIEGVSPSGMRGGFPIWKIKNVAPRLVPFEGDLEEVVRRMNHNDLPPMLSKEFWTAKRQRQVVEQAEGNLHTTEEVTEILAEAFKNLRMNLLLIPDAVERQTQLSVKSRDLIRDLVHSALDDLKRGIIETFAEKTGQDETEADDDDPLSGL